MKCPDPGKANVASGRATSSWLFALPWDPQQPGGVDQVVLNLFRNLAVDGKFTPRMLIASWDHPRPVESTDEGRATIRLRLRSPLASTSTILPAIRWLATLPGSFSRLVRLMRTRSVVVVNVHFPGLWALQFGLVKRWLPQPRLILSFHGLDIGTAEQARGLSRWWWRRLLRSADVLVACSDDLATKVRAFDPAISDRTVVIHNGLDVGEFLAEGDRDCELDPRLRGRRFVLSVAAFEPKKGLDVLIRAFSKVIADRDSDVLLVLVGVDRGLRRELVALAEELDVGRQVFTFTDVPHAQLHPFYRAATAFCLPSRSEPFGLVLLEAGAFGLPVVASQVGGIPEVITHGETGRLVAAGDPDALARELADLLRRPEECARLGRSLQQRVREQFTWKSACSRYLALAGSGCAAPLTANRHPSE